jgi:hypothetical protein
MSKASSYSTRSRGAANDSPRKPCFVMECDFEYKGHVRQILDADGLGIVLPSPPDGPTDLRHAAVGNAELAHHGDLSGVGDGRGLLKLPTTRAILATGSLLEAADHDVQAFRLPTPLVMAAASSLSTVWPLADNGKSDVHT